MMEILAKVSSKSNFTLKWDNAPADYGSLFDVSEVISAFDFAVGTLPLSVVVRNYFWIGGEFRLMDDRLLKKYLEYANSEEAFAVLFVKKHLIQAKGHWVDIVDCRRYIESTDKLHFKFIIGGLYKRKINPKYPSKSEYTINGRFDERKYYLMTRAITWETAHTDIEQQKQNNVVASKFDISGIYFDKNLGSTGYFVDSAPLEIKALENNLLDYTNPLWDIAERYRNKPDFVYKVERVDIIRHDS